MCVCVCSPLIELPPLSPGIQVRVMEEVEVVETVRRGWSGGTEEHRVFSQTLFGTDVVPNGLFIPCTKRLTMMVSKPRVLVAVQV